MLSGCAGCAWNNSLCPDCRQDSRDPVEEQVLHSSNRQTGLGREDQSAPVLRQLPTGN